VDVSQSILKQKNIDIKKEKIVADNIVLAKSEQREIDFKREKIVADNIFLAKSKQKEIDIKKDKIVAHNIVLAKSRQKEIDVKKEKIVADNIILAQSRSAEEKLYFENVTREKLVAEYDKNFKLIFNSSSDVLFDADLVTNEVILSDAYEKEFGYKITSNMTQAKNWFSHIHPDDKEAVMQDYQRMLASDEMEWKSGYRFLKADNSVANILSSRIVLRNAVGKAYRMIGSMHDISKQKVLEERLEQEIRLKEKQIAEATVDARETTRSDIGKELHDNVNQLLGASRLYLDMAKRGGEHSEMYLSRSSLYTVSAIEEIRKLSKGLTTDIINNLGLCEAIDSLTRDAMEVNPVKISFAMKSFIEDSVNDKFKLNVYRILQEQLNNILKHAKATEVAISLSQNKKSIGLTVSDNGVGFDTGQKRRGIGLVNIKNRAVSYHGTADFVSRPGHGCVLTIIFPVTGAVLNKS
jgi:PAS domain S-box-containing protein